MKHPNKQWNTTPSFDSDYFHPKSYLNSCGSSNGSLSNGSLSNGSLSSPEIFELAPGQAECSLASGCTKGAFHKAIQWVRMSCTNPSCVEIKQLHLECFLEWQNRFSSAVNSSRSRHYSDIPTPPNVMLYKNYDLLFKLCGCRCNGGILIHELDHSSSPCSSSNDEFSPFSVSNQFKQPPRRTSFSIKDRPFNEMNRMLSDPMNVPTNKNNLISFQNDFANMNSAFNNIVASTCRYPPNTNGFNNNKNFSNNNNFNGVKNGVNNFQHILNNFSNPNGNGFYPQSLLPTFNKINANNANFDTNSNNNGMAQNAPATPSGKKQIRGSYSMKTFDFFPSIEKAAAGNIFHHRKTMESFKKLPKSSQNSYHVRVEDDGPYGNDEIRCFILTTFSCLQKTTIQCVLCRNALKIYDKYPLVDGTFFLSMDNYEKCGVEVTLTKKMQQLQHQNQQQRYLNSVCTDCMNSSEAACKACHKAWDGSAFIVGTMYNYDIFAAMSCCSSRFSCINCDNPTRILNPDCPLTFSEAARPCTCSKCGREAHHTIKPLSKIFNMPNKGN